MQPGCVPLRVLPLITQPFFLSASSNLLGLPLPALAGQISQLLCHPPQSSVPH